MEISTLHCTCTCICELKGVGLYIFRTCTCTFLESPGSVPSRSSCGEGLVLREYCVLITSQETHSGWVHLLPQWLMMPLLYTPIKLLVLGSGLGVKADHTAWIKYYGEYLTCVVVLCAKWWFLLDRPLTNWKDTQLWAACGLCLHLFIVYGLLVSHLEVENVALNFRQFLGKKVSPVLLAVVQSTSPVVTARKGGRMGKRNWIGWIFDFHFQNGETATFKPYFCNETRPRSTYVYTGCLTTLPFVHEW